MNVARAHVLSTIRLQCPRLLDVTMWLALTSLFVGFTLGDRGFAHLSLNFYGIPFYVTELTLAFTVLVALVAKRREFLRLTLAAPLPLRLYWLFGAIALVTGIAHGFGLQALRDSALVYYSLFYLMVPVIFSSRRRLMTFLILLLAAILLSTCIGLYQTFALAPEWLTGPRVGVATSLYASFGFLFSVIWFVQARSPLRKSFCFAGAILTMTIVIALQVRSAWVALLLSAAAIASLGLKFVHLRRQLTVSLWVALAASGASLTILHAAPVVVDFWHTIVPEKTTHLSHPESERPRISMVIGIQDEAMSIFHFTQGASASQNNVRWRLMAWHDLLHEWLQEPFFGVGFGKPFMSPSILRAGWGHDPSGIDPHNSLLAILYRMGPFALMGFLWFIMVVGKQAMRLVAEEPEDSLQLLTVVVAASVVSVLGNSLFAVVLEGPYMGAFFWLGAGALVALGKFLRSPSQAESDSDRLAKT